MNDSALGSTLIIPESAFKEIERIEKKLDDIKNKADDTAKGVTASFNTMALSTNGFITALDNIISKLETINSTTKNAPKNPLNIGTIIKAAGSINSLSGTLRGLYSQEKTIAAAGPILAEKRAQAEEKVKQAKQATLTEINKTAIAEEKTAQTSLQVIAQQSKTSQEAAKVNQERYKAQRESINADKEKIRIQTAEANKSAEVTRAVTAETKAKSEMIKQQTVETQFIAQEIKLKTQEAKLSIEESRLKQTEAKAHLAVAKAIEIESKAMELEAKAQQRANKSKNRATNFSDFNSVISQNANASTLADHKNAIQELRKALMALDTTDSKYKQNLATVNKAIEQHTKVLRDAGVASNSLARKTSYLTDYLSKLAQRALALFTINSVKNFVSQMVEVRGQMEMSQRSLQSILQDKAKADGIFNKTVALAVKSPFRIKDLVDYTRQLSAYRIESDKLYDTTKRLADVSAGLGVDMSRLILAYGQVKAAAYLRGSEVRQFTEAGVNMYGELQDYFKEVKGEAYTTAQIVDMISKRMVKFEDVEAIFQRMTDKGGMFYNMQEVQSQTLWGTIQKFYDSVDVMFNEIGKDSEGFLKSLVGGATDLLKHWEALASVLKTSVSIIALMAIYMRQIGATKINTLFTNVTNGQTINYFKLLKDGIFSAKDALVIFGKNLKAAFISNIYIVALVGLISVLNSLRETYNKYHEEQAKINEETINLTKNTSDLVRQYKELASARKKINKDGKEIVIDKNLGKEKEILKKLYDNLESNELEVPIKIGEVNVDNIDKAIKESADKLNMLVTMAQDAKSYINADDNSYWNNGHIPILGIQVLPDSFSEDMKDLSNATNKVLVYTTKMQTAIDALGEDYDKLSKRSKKAYDSIKDGPRKGEHQVEYMVRASKKMEDIIYDAQNKNRKTLSFIKSQLYGIWGGLKNEISDSFGGGFRSAKIEATKEMHALFNNINGIYGKELKKMKPMEIKAYWDKVATENQLGELQRLILLRIVKQYYPIKIEEDEKNVKETAFTIKDQLQAELDKLKINVKVDTLTNNPFKGYTEQMEDLNKGLKSYSETLDYLNRHPKKAFLVNELKAHGMPEEFFNGLKGRRTGKTLRDNDYIDHDRAKKYVEEQIKTLRKLGAKVKDDDKKENETLQERVNLLKEMNSEYNKQIKIKSNDKALADTREIYKEAAQNVGWNVNDILPDDAAVADRIRELGATAKDVAKKGNYFRIAASIEFNMDEKEYNKLKDDVSKNIDEAFSQLDLYKKLKKEGLSDELIKSIFGDITTSFEELGEEIDDEFNRFTIAAYETLYGKDFTKWGEEVIQQYNSDLNNTENLMKKSGEDTNKAYLEKKKKLNEKIKQNTIDTFNQLLKDYKTQLSDQLQLDTWYFEERSKIESNENLKSQPNLKKELLTNLEKKYNEKTSTNSWNKFKGSDTYLNLFSNLETVSTKSIEHMRRKLNTLKEQMKDLNPSQLKEIMSVYNKMDEQLNKRNPLKALTDSLSKIREYKNKGITEDSLVQGITDRDTESAKLEEQISLINRIIYLKKNSSKQTEDDKAFIEANNALYSQTTEELEKQITAKKESVNKNNKDNTEASEQLKEWTKARASLQNLQEAWDTIKSKGVSAMSSINQILEAVGADTDSTAVTFVNMAGSIADLVIQAIMFQLQLKLCTAAADEMGTAMSAAMGVIGWIALALEGVATVLTTIFGNRDKRLQKQIEDLENRVKKLDRAYEKLKKSMDDAFDITAIQEYNEASINTLKKEKDAYAAMLKAEKARKKADKSKIQEYENKIEDLDDAIKELGENMQEALGGFGSQANYKSAAQKFADAWVSAFNEGSDTLDALNEKFDDYFDNLLKKQIMMRASAKFIEPILKKFDEIVSQGSEGDNNGLSVTMDELNALKSLKDKNLTQYNEYVKSLIDILGVNPKTTSGLSALQQGIQSVSESTAQALESILNSMRYFLSTQQSDVAAIRNILEQRLGLVSAQSESGGASNQMISLMQQQTGYLRQICDNWSDVMKSGHKLGGKGLKVFMN